MAIDIKATEVGGADVVAISGKIVGSAQSSREFHELIKSLIDDGKRKFVIDLTETPWTNSLGVGMLMGAYTSVKGSQGVIVLANATERIRDLLKVTRLDLVFEIFDSVDDALAHLGSV